MDLKVSNMENQETEFVTEEKTPEFYFKKHVVKALLGALYYLIVYIPFILPFKVWGKAATRVSALWESKSISYNENSAKYPIYSFYFNYFINFIFDAVMVLIWPLGFIFVTFFFFKDFEQTPFFDYYIITLLKIYLSVIGIRLMKETYFFIINNLGSWLLNTIINIGKLVKNMWLLNFVYKKKLNHIKEINTNEL